MSALWLDNVLAYSVQFGVLVASAMLAAWALGLRAPRATLRLWQALALAAIGLPLLQPWGTTSAGLVASSIRFATEALTPQLPPPDPIGFPATVLTLLIAGAVLRLIWLGVGLVRLKALERESTPLDPLPDFVIDLQRRLGTSARIRVSDRLEGPATVGSNNAVILIPRRVLDLSVGIQRAIVCHELLHVKRGDWMRTVVEEIGCAVLWFHPAARVLASRLNLAREGVVDLMTIAQTMDRRTYAEALLAFATARPAHVATVTPFIRRRHLAQRLALVLQEVPMSRSRVTALSTVCLLLVALATTAAVSVFPLAATAAAQGKETVYKPGDGISLPKVVKESKPKYTREALQAKIQGSVHMEMVVSTTGVPVNIRVIKSLDDTYGLDKEAVKAAGEWRFEPGRKGGKPVPVQIEIEMTFTLK